MSGFSNGLAAAAAALSLCSVSTATIAAAPAAPVAASQAPAFAIHSNQWLMLSAMTTNSGAASRAAAIQSEAEMGFPPWPALAVILATIAVAFFIVVEDDDGDVDFDLPASPS